MLSHAGLPQSFWAEAVSTAMHVINRSPSSGLDFQVAEEVWAGKPPSYAHLRVFGCEAFCHVPKDKRSKLDPKSIKCIFLGYGDSGEMGYRLWDPQPRKIVRSHDVVFHEDKMHRQPEKVVEICRVIFQEEPRAPAQPVGQPTAAADAHGQGVGQATGQAAEPAVGGKGASA